MFKKLLGIVGIGLAAAGTSPAAQPYEPYAKGTSANKIYDLLFCDNPSAFQPKPDRKPVDWQLLLFGAAQDPAKIAGLADDPGVESRIRALAYNWLRTHGHPTPKKIVLGVVIEVPLERGLDALAAYADGSVRYINQTGKIASIEPDSLSEANLQAQRMIGLAQPIVAHIGPWDKARLRPPVSPRIRLTFIVSDGLYFGEGPFKAMEQDSLASPLIQQGANLITLLARKVQRDP